MTDDEVPLAALAGGVGAGLFLVAVSVARSERNPESDI